jgi:hypothetical protein
MKMPKEAIIVRVPSEKKILKHPKRAWFVCGGWIDSAEPSIVNVYWHRRQERFTVFSFLQVLEHEMLHAVLALRLGLEVSRKLDNVHRSVFVLLDKNGKRGVFANEFRFSEDWVFPPYLEEPTEDVLE